MYTQCSKCETVFKLSAEVLRAAGGQVRCGKCGAVFNALSRLAEDSSSFETGESPLDLETRADNILESVVPLPAPNTAPQDDEEFGPPGVEIAHLQFLDIGDEEPIEAPGDRSMEFTLPPGELDRIFVESKKRAARPPSLDLDAGVGTGVGTGAGTDADPDADPDSGIEARTNDSAKFGADGDVRTDVGTGAGAGTAADAGLGAAAGAGAGPDAETFAPRTPAQRPPARPYASPQAPRLPMPPAPPTSSAALPSLPAASESALPIPSSELLLPPHPESAITLDRRVRNGVSGFEVSEEVRREMLAGIEDDAQTARAARMVARTDLESPRTELSRRTDRRPFALWLGGAIVAALLLATQIVNQNREWFFGTGPLGASLRALFSSLGASVEAPANLSAYQLRQWGVTGDPAANGTLRVRASILNTAAQLQPYPLLRVTLANRFGSRIGARDFEPSEYLGKPTARLLAPGERADATLDILDPGKSAEGFEIDVCLRQTDNKIACASDVAPQTKK